MFRHRGGTRGAGCWSRLCGVPLASRVPHAPLPAMEAGAPVGLDSAKPRSDTKKNTKS